MSLPVLLTSDMMGSPNLTPTNGSLNALLHACLVNGFNTQSVVSATASGGVVTFNFSSAPGFSALDTVLVAGATNSDVNGQRRVLSAASNQVLFDIPGVPNGAVGGSITVKFAPLGWTRAFSGTNVAAYRQGGSATHKRFMRVYDHDVVAAGYAAYVRGYENMTGISSGSGPFPTTAQVAGNGNLLYSIPYDSTGDSPSTQHRAWVLIGTPRFFTLYVERDRGMYAGDAKTPISGFQRNGTYNFMFGETANHAKAADAFACLCADYSVSSVFLPRSVAGTGGSTTAMVTITGGPGRFSPGLTWPSPADGGLHLQGPPIVYDSVSPYGFRGTLPGALAPLEAPFTGFTSTPMTVGTILQNIPGVTGRVLMAGHVGAGYSDLGWLLDEDWGDM